MSVTHKKILELNASEARKFFLKGESYCNIELPKYFSFSGLLTKISQAYSAGTEINSIMNQNKIWEFDDVNHIIYANKDGKLSWRPLQLIHPVAYIDLVHKITETNNWEKLQKRFEKFQKNNKIKCLSIPVLSNNQQSDKAQQILNWYEEVEQQSINMSLQYDYIFDTDIADCYGSIYTHSIAWAVESLKIAKDKTNRNDYSLLGNYIDKSIQNTQYGQTNGIPQGSVLMDFIAEIVLGYIDRILAIKLKKEKISEYQILRYRDDYRIFVKNSADGENILKILSEIMMSFGLKLNASKTRGSQDVITQSIKKDKLAWWLIPEQDKSLQKRLLVIRQHSIAYPNSGSLVAAVNQFDQRLEKMIKKDKKIQYTEQLISIVTDIAYNNPKVIPVCCSIISKLLEKVDNRSKIAQLVYQKLSKMPNSGFAQIWLQRMLKAHLNQFDFDEKLCKLPQGNQIQIWNNSWIRPNAKKINKALETSIFTQTEFDNLSSIISNSEIDIFNSPYEN